MMHTKTLIQPFDVNIDPMKRLLLINFNNDKDSVYLGFEPQYFDDEINGTGYLIIAWRVDGFVDLYYEGGLNINPSKYNIAGKGMANKKLIANDGNFFYVNNFGVRAQFAFIDIYDRSVNLIVKESHPATRKPFGLLAPMGAMAEKPQAMPLIMLEDFYFARKNHSEIVVEIAGRQHKVDELPMPMDATKMTMIRYSDRPIIATLNPAANYAAVKMYDLSQFQPKKVDGAQEIQLAWNEGKACISSISYNNDIHQLKLAFYPAFPDIACLQNDELQEGKFSVSAHKSVGVVQGSYKVSKKNNTVRISMTGDGGWKPNVTKLSTWLVFRGVKYFREWPRTYLWEAELEISGGKEVLMQSEWKRIKINKK